MSFFKNLSNAGKLELNNTDNGLQVGDGLRGFVYTATGGLLGSGVMKRRPDETDAEYAKRLLTLTAVGVQAANTANAAGVDTPDKAKGLAKFAKLLFSLGFFALVFVVLRWIWRKVSPKIFKKSSRKKY